jgi:hypothetical protein
VAQLFSLDGIRTTKFMQTPTLNEKIGRIVTELGDTKDDVLALTDELCQELWQKIDRRDVDSIRAIGATPCRRWRSKQLAQG